MNRMYILFFTLTLALFSFKNTDEDNDNPCLYHHVNVITGQLSLQMEDGVVQGGVQVPIRRTYSSFGALERTDDNGDMHLKRLKKGFHIQGGWNFFPHAHLLIRPGRRPENYEAYVSDPYGSVTVFEYSFTEKTDKTIALAPKEKNINSYSKISGKNNRNNSLLFINEKCGNAELNLPDGSILYYQGRNFKARKDEGSALTAFYTLTTEIKPNKHIVSYSYDSKNRLQEIKHTTPNTGKCLASIYFHLDQPISPYKFHITTSDEKKIEYNFKVESSRDYLDSVIDKSGKKQKYEYGKERKGIGARVNCIRFDGKVQSKISYYLPDNKKEEELWRKSPEKAPFCADKVHTLQGPLGPRGEMITYAEFSYFDGLTVAKDCEGMITKFYHNDGKLNVIEEYDTSGNLTTKTKFSWLQDNMISKMRINAEGRALFSKNFLYDSCGNVTQEIFYGNLSGDRSDSFSINEDGSLEDADSFVKTYAYSKKMNLLLSESEENGLSYKYFYKEGTNILVKKLTLDKDKILIREFFVYDEDNLLIEKIIDDGCNENITELNGVTERKITKFSLDNRNGRITSISDLYLNLRLMEEVLVKKTELIYASNNLVTEERVYDQTNTYRYSIHRSYDDLGRIIYQTTPTEEKNTFTYDNFGNLTSIKEVGKPLRKLYYDIAGRLTKEEECTLDGEKRSKSFLYDSKGRIVSCSDFNNNITYQYYDSQGRCSSTILPSVFDENGEPYTPAVRFSYDAMGNLSSICDPNGHTTVTHYTSTRKPCHIVHADGGATYHRYDKYDRIIKSIHPDGSFEEFKYDTLGRIIKKSSFSSNEELITEESFTYNAFHKTSYTNEKGLTTHFLYDFGGKLIEERALDRSITYTYDELGALKAKTQGPISYVQISDVSSRVIEKWEEDTSGKIENKTKFVYDNEGRKALAIRNTSKGKAKDSFEYDALGRLILHTDALGNKTKFQYIEKVKNDQNIYSMKKIKTDARGVRTEEYFDAQKRLIGLQKFASSKICAKEEIFYDRSGNKAKHITHIYPSYKQSEPHIVEWKHDFCGRVIEQIEAKTKRTKYEYDLMGRLVRKTMPSGIDLHYEYDAIGRIVAHKSSDLTLDYAYYYGPGRNPEIIEDIINESYIQREYDIFDQLVKETDEYDHCTMWEYDSIGRCKCLTLPDKSYISYHYQGLHMNKIERSSSSGKIYQHGYDDFDENGHVHRETYINNNIMITERDLLERPYVQISKWNEYLVEYGPTGLVTKTKNSLTDESHYEYDGLDQITRENEKKYSFDSIGNPTNGNMGLCNELYEVDDIHLVYDDNGCLIKKTVRNKITTYDYDCLGRLIFVHEKGSDPVYLSYDPLGRLSAKRSSSSYKKFIYDHNFEIGSMDENNRIIELKILGLGMQGDIGSAVAIELSNEVFIPLHDLQGNIIALLSSNGGIGEIIDMNAFGESKSQSQLSPWGFCSKRIESDLIFFGQRFYDPAIKRWITPDPSGFSDGNNLYAYIRNSPKNRLDLFGLSSEHIIPHQNMSLEIPIEFIASNASMHTLPVFTTEGSIDGVKVNWLVKLGENVQLKFSSEEIKKGKFNLFDHYHDFVANKGKTLGLISFQNGILTKLDDVKDVISSLSSMSPGTMILSLYNPTESGLKDVINTCTEVVSSKIDTEMTALTRQYFAAMSSTLFKINPEAAWIHIAHSRAGGIAARALEGMSSEQMQIMKENFHYLGLGPSLPVAASYTSSSINCYSEYDNLTISMGIRYLRDPDYNIQIVPSLVNFKQFAPRFDHSISGETYKNQARELIQSFEKQLENIR